MITDLLRQSVKSYRELPQILYHIQWKFRDEVRPRFGVMRGREFLMKDAYSFDLDYAGAVVSYRRMMLAYMRTFQRMGVKAIPMVADTGPIGGNLSHEFIILAPTGESQVFYDARVRAHGFLAAPRSRTQSEADLERFLRADDDAVCGHRREARRGRLGRALQDKREGRGIEVGHIFYFGTKYSRADGPDRGRSRRHARSCRMMGSYGVGVSRLVGALIEAHHDDAGIIWPDSVAPFQAAILNLQGGRRGVRRASARIFMPSSAATRCTTTATTGPA